MEVSMLPQPEIAVPYWSLAVDCENEAPPLNLTISTNEQYTKYYGSGAYDRRYPRANHFTLEAIRYTLEKIHSKPALSKILDFGCGSGRYAIPLAPHCKTIVAYDPCPEAINLLNRQTQQNVMPSHDLGDVLRAAPYDMVVCIFGVLSHIPQRQERLNTLRFLRSCLAADGLLFASVPNRLRRFYKEQVTSVFKRGDFSGRIDYRRGRGDQLIPYYLYTPASLRSELEECKLSVRSVKAESLLPERFVTNSDHAIELEKKVLRKIPPWLGYGLLAIAHKA
jgi:tRNA (uracil-5-)-methyltransferase TRM9